MKTYKDYDGSEITEETIIVWGGMDGESEASAGVGNGAMWSWKRELTAKRKGKRLVFVSEEGSEYEWEEIDDRTNYENYIKVKTDRQTKRLGKQPKRSEENKG